MIISSVMASSEVRLILSIFALSARINTFRTICFSSLCLVLMPVPWMNTIPPRKTRLSRRHWSTLRIKLDLPMPGTPSSWTSLWPEQMFCINSNMSFRRPFRSLTAAGISLTHNFSVKLTSLPFCSWQNCLHTWGSFLSAARNYKTGS